MAETENLAALVTERWNAGRRETSKLVQDYWLNYAFLEGHHYIKWLDAANYVVSVAAEPSDDRIRAVMNRIASNTRTIIAKTVQRELTFEVLPHDSDDSHLRGARISESIVESLRHSHDWEHKRELLTRAACKGGTAAMCVEWDKNKGNTLAEDMEDGRAPIKEGDTVETVLSIAEFVVEGGMDPLLARYWIKGVAVPPEIAQEVYDLDETPKAGAIFGLSGLNAGMESQADKTDKCLVYTMFERPNKKCPEGRIITVIDDKVVQKAKWYFPFKTLNIALIHETPREDTCYGDTIWSHVRSAQTLYNMSWNKMMEHLRSAGDARMVLPQSMYDQANSLVDDPAEPLLMPDGANNQQPFYLTPPQMPGWWIQAPEALAAAIDDLMGIHAVSRGDAPANIESGYGLSILSENDTTPGGRLIKETARAWSSVASMVLKLYEHYTSEKRDLSIKVDGGIPLTTQWTGDDMKGQTTAVVPLEDIIPRSRAAQQKMADQVMQMGLIESFEQYAVLAELPGRSHMLSVVAPDIAKARRENAGFAVGRQAEPADFDDHAAHIKTHNDFRKSLEYQLLTPEDRAMVDTHLQAHQTMAAELLGKQQDAAKIGGEMLAGAPTAQGGPPTDPALAAASVMPEVAPPAPMPEPAAAPEPVSPDQVTADILAALEAGGGQF